MSSFSNSNTKLNKTIVEQQEEEIRKCPKCGSKLWNVIKYSAVTGLFILACDDCRYSENKEWVYTNPKDK
jgi:predicted  nucleic acid-binding Zn ribbon protein